MSNTTFIEPFGKCYNFSQIGVYVMVKSVLVVE